MTGYEVCPLCAADLRDAPIPGDTDGRHYLRTIGVCIPGVYDGVLFWACPDCQGAWHRWAPEDGRRYEAAARAITKWMEPTREEVTACPGGDG